MDTDKVKIYGVRVRVDSMAKVAELEAAEKDKMREKELFADAGILSIEHADFDDIERLALFEGGLGRGLKNGVILSRAYVFNKALMYWMKLKDLCVTPCGVLSQTVNDSRVLLGAGWPEMVMATAVDELAKRLLLRAEHQKEESNVGIDIITGQVGDMAELGISEAFKVKQAVLLSATEAAELILRIDEIITYAPRRREHRM
ncbi:hypothetical protein K7X08_031960 [Anisodus acutangulus]|uniref:Uncharacterized protein n=1 Tax=Anisodus acutangulus TaxID=402998 RepID=A0A9Q1RJT4_9SOLA|nr:hypothetical protein K7X08_031960 [Anisodus acutangulus]